MFRLSLLAVCALWLTCASAAAECEFAPAPERIEGVTSATGTTTVDQVGRMVAPISVNGVGPFRFVVDTGANRSVLSFRLAARLGLTSHGEGPVHSVEGVVMAPLVRVQSLHYAELSLPTTDLPLLRGDVLAGEQGVLGVDGMEGRRLMLDFRRRCIEIIPSAGAPRLHSWTAVRGELRFGHLVVIPGRIDRVRVNVLIDTGSDTSLANNALRAAIEASTRRDRSFMVMATAGDAVRLERAMIVPRLTMGELNVENLAAYVGDYHIFDLWELSDEPTLLLGMDILEQSRAMAIDYGTGTVYFRLNSPTRTRTGTILPGTRGVSPLESTRSY